MRTGSANSLIVVQRIGRIRCIQHDGAIESILELMATAFIGAGLAPQGSDALVGDDRDHY